MVSSAHVKAGPGHSLPLSGPTTSSERPERRGGDSTPGRVAREWDALLDVSISRRRSSRVPSPDRVDATSLASSRNLMRPDRVIGLPRRPRSCTAQDRLVVADTPSRGTPARSSPDRRKARSDLSANPPRPALRLHASPWRWGSASARAVDDQAEPLAVLAQGRWLWGSCRCARQPPRLQGQGQVSGGRPPNGTDHRPAPTRAQTLSTSRPSRAREGGRGV